MRKLAINFIGERYKCDGEIWEIHNNDLDNWPSEVHAHNYSRKEVLDVCTGYIYSKVTGLPLRKMSKKLMAFILHKISAGKLEKVKSKLKEANLLPA